MRILMLTRDMGLFSQRSWARCVSMVSLYWALDGGLNDKQDTFDFVFTDDTSLSVCLNYVYCCCDVTSWPSITWGRNDLFHSWFHTAIHHQKQWGQEPGGRSWCRGHGGVLLPGLLPMACSVHPSYRTQDHLPWNGATHHGLGHPCTITKWESALQLDLIETLPPLRLLPLWWL